MLGAAVSKHNDVPVFVENGVKIKCPVCKQILAIENDSEIVYRSIGLLLIDKKNRETKVKCRNCKTLVKIS